MTYMMQEDTQPDMPSVGTASSFRIPQPGKRPLVFNGTELAMAMSFTPGIPYWYEINLYHSQDQSYVVAIRLFYEAEFMEDVARAWSFSSIDEALQHFELYDAGRDVQMPNVDLDALAPAELAAMAMSVKAQVDAARQHFEGLVGEFFAEIEDARKTAA